MKSHCYILILSLALTAPAFSVHAALPQVDALLGRLGAQSSAALKAEERSRDTAMRRQLREQISPGNPENVLLQQQETIEDRAAYLAAMQKAAQPAPPKKP